MINHDEIHYHITNGYIMNEINILCSLYSTRILNCKVIFIDNIKSSAMHNIKPVKIMIW